eukprot:1835330-Prymnesium_polylepis.1
MVLWAAVQCSCVLLAWAMLGWTSLVGMRDVRARIARVEAGRRSARRRSTAPYGPYFAAKKSCFSVRLRTRPLRPFGVSGWGLGRAWSASGSGSPYNCARGGETFHMRFWSPTASPWWW